MPPSKVMIIRHAEKPMPGGPETGVDRDGNQDPEALIVRGWQRSGALARLFAPVDGHFHSGALACPASIFAPGIGPGSQSKRPWQTLQPLSELLGLEISDACLKGEEQELAAAILRQDGVVLVAWEHKAIPAVLAGVTGHSVASPGWPEDRFDIILVLDRTSSGWTLTQVPQMLLKGDRRDLLV
jgi:hypothetical protein